MGCKERWRPAVLAVAFAGLSVGQELGQNAATFQGTTFVSSAPIADTAEILQSRYGVAVTYEDPVWQWAGDFQNRPGQPYGMFRLQRTVNIPDGLTPDQTPALSAAAVGRALEEYHKNYDAPRYRIFESKFGLHIVPETVRDPSGSIVRANNPLDTVVDIPVAARSAEQHLDAVCATASRLARLQLQCGTSAWGNEARWWKQAFAAPVDMLEWGGSAISARDALIDLFSRLNTTLSWRLRCANPTTGDHVCVLTVEPVQVAKPDGKGGLSVTRLLNDRCPTCAPPAGPTRSGPLPGPPPPVR
jgi:hypothetical protein